MWPVSPGGCRCCRRRCWSCGGPATGARCATSSYRASGGVRGAVARLAEDAYNQLGESERRIARGLMLRLASGEDGTLARRRVPLGELERIAGARPVLAELTDARLLTVSDGEVELSHEALLREWPRYRTWLEEDRIGRRLHAHLTAAARDWDARGRDAGDCTGARGWPPRWSGGQQHEQELNQAEREFLDASRAAAERAAQRRAARIGGSRLWSLPLLLVSRSPEASVALSQTSNSASDHGPRGACPAARRAGGQRAAAGSGDAAGA